MIIANAVDKFIEEKRAEQIRSHDKFRASDAGRCHRMRYWKRQGKQFTDEHDARTQRVFEVGHVFHKWLQDILEKKGLLQAAEMEVEDQHRVGHVDAIVKTDEGLVLYDFKTIHSRKFHWLQRYNGDIHYAMQACTYALMLPYDDIADVRIAYISKDDLCIEEISVWKEYEKIVLHTIHDWTMLIEAWSEQKEPSPNPAKWECKYCVYRSACQGEQI